MDSGALIGFVVAFVSVLIANMMEGGNLGQLLNPSAGLLVIGGTLGATLASAGSRPVAQVPAAILYALRAPRLHLTDTIEKMVALAHHARREGLLSLEEEQKKLDDPFFAKGLQYVIDGTDPDTVANMMAITIQAEQRNRLNVATTLETAGGFAPTMGIIGTVLGLIHVLGHLEDTSKLGPAIAVAFMATFYGIATANLLWLPLANKIKANAQAEAEMRRVVAEGVLSIQKGDNPSTIREKLQAFVTASAAGGGKRGTAGASSTQAENVAVGAPVGRGGRLMVDEAGFWQDGEERRSGDSRPPGSVRVGDDGHGGGGGHDGAGTTRWLLTYADLITLLLAFFVVLYAMSEVNSAKYQALAASLRVAFATAGETVIDTAGSSPNARRVLEGLNGDIGQPFAPRPQGEEELLLGLVERINAALHEAGLGGRASAELTEWGVVITFQEQVFFDLGRAKLRPGGRELLGRLAPILASVPGTILVEGHTDDLPIRGGPFPSNWELSTARATTVVRFLTEQAGLDPRRLAAVGYGEWRPRYPNDSEVHRTRNRRVEVVLLRWGLDPTARSGLPR